MSGYLELSSEPTRFEPVSKITNVFYDETNKEVLSVRSGGTLGVVVKGDTDTITFCMDNKGSISSIKFSPDHAVVAIQRTSTSLELFLFNDGTLGTGHMQDCKTKGSTLLGFIWTSPTDLVLVNNLSVEFYQVVPEKLSVRYLRSYSQTTKWFVWSPECHLLLLCTHIGTTFATLQPFTVKPGQIVKNQKFEVEMSSGDYGQHSGTQSATLGERDISVGIIYGKTAICVLQHSTSTTNDAHLDVYTMSRENLIKRSHICKIGLSGKFAVNLLDNLVVLHHQFSKTSLIFDIHQGLEFSQDAITVFPLTLPVPICPFALEESAGPASSIRSVPCQLYAPTWVIFQPDVIIDARLGCLWKLQLKLESLPPHVELKNQLVECLLRRKCAKNLVIKVVKEIVESGDIAPLSEIFDKINQSYRQHLDSILKPQMAECVSGGHSTNISGSSSLCVVVDQAEMYSSIFAPIMQSAEESQEVCSTDTMVSPSFNVIIGVILDYIRSLKVASITVQHFLYELIINSLVRTGQFYQLHQLLQYHVLADSKPLACLLLSLVGMYSAGEQLSLDMLNRLNTAHDEITEILLSQNMVIQALRYSETVGLASTISARKFLEISLSCSPMVFYSTFKFFAIRNATLRGNSVFAKGEHCDIYVDHFRNLFGESMEEAFHQS